MMPYKTRNAVFISNHPTAQRQCTSESYITMFYHHYMYTSLKKVYHPTTNDKFNSNCWIPI